MTLQLWRKDTRSRNVAWVYYELWRARHPLEHAELESCLPSMTDEQILEMHPQLCAAVVVSMRDGQPAPYVSTRTDNPRMVQAGRMRRR